MVTEPFGTDAEPPAPEPSLDELPAVEVQLLRFLADHHGGFDDEGGFVARALADHLTWTQPVVIDTIGSLEQRGHIEVERQGRRIHRVELTESGRAAVS